jgi:hypothetical protein
MNPSFSTIALKEIDREDLFFQIQPAVEDPRLNHSVSEIGLAEPLWLQPLTRSHRDGDSGRPRYRLVTGFRRFKAAEAAGLLQVPAFLFPEFLDDLAIYRWLVVKKSAGGPLTPLEASRVISTLSQALSLPEHEIVHTWLPLMGLAPNPKMFSLYLPLASLEAELQRALAADELGVEVASALAAANHEDRMAFWHLIQVLRLGRNRQREFWLLLCDAAALKNQAIARLLEEPDCTALLRDPELTPSQKCDRCKTLFMQWRYPEYSALLARFEGLVRAAKLPPGIHLRPTPWFSGEEFYLDFSFRSAEEFSRALDVLRAMQEKGVVEKLVQLT